MLIKIKSGQSSSLSVLFPNMGVKKYVSAMMVVEAEELKLLTKDRYCAAVQMKLSPLSDFS